MLNQKKKVKPHIPKWRKKLIGKTRGKNVQLLAREEEEIINIGDISKQTKVDMGSPRKTRKLHDLTNGKNF